jgi:aminoglycoside phosphotransferase (APT) family kinase protein
MGVVKVKNEVLALQLLQQVAGVPTARILCIDTSERILPYGYFVMERLAGGSLREGINRLPLDQLRQVIRSISAYLKGIHAIQLPRFGALRHDRSLAVEEMVTPTTISEDICRSLRLCAGLLCCLC